MRNLDKSHLENMINCKRMSTAIRRAKKHLVSLAKNEGFYENFGQLEIGYIENHFINISDYSDEMNGKRNELASFRRWIDNLNMKTLNEYL